MTAFLALMLGLTACGDLKNQNTLCTKGFADAYNDVVTNINAGNFDLKKLKNSCQRLASAPGPNVCQGENNGRVIWVSKAELDPICEEVL